MKKDLFLSLLLSIVLIPSLDFFVEKEAPQTIQIIIEPTVEIERAYGLAIDSFLVDKGEITPNLFLSTLFSDYGIDRKQVHAILQKTDGIFDVRKIKRGNTFAVFRDADSTVNYVVYEKTAVDYVVFDFTDSLNVFLGKKEINIQINTAAGSIQSSLWVALANEGNNPLLANELSEIYAWTIDFFGLQKNDQFKIIYEEQFVDGQSIGFGKVHAAYFEHNGAPIYAIPFTQDSVEAYFDITGESLRKAFLKAPLQYSRISSGFSHSRMHPVLKYRRPHLGVDYAAPMGTPVHSIGDGVVLKANYSGGAGHYVKIKHNGTYTTGYMHLSKYGAGIKPGARVTQGQIIGYVGSTGLSTGAHLDFRVWLNGQNIDPTKIEAPPVDPIKAENQLAFDKAKAKYTNLLNEIQITTTMNQE